jgi:hypothetical protein
MLLAKIPKLVLEDAFTNIANGMGKIDMCKFLEF